MLGSAIAHTPKYMSFDGSINVSRKQELLPESSVMSTGGNIREIRGWSVCWVACNRCGPAPMGVRRGLAWEPLLAVARRDKQLLLCSA